MARIPDFAISSTCRETRWWGGWEVLPRFPGHARARKSAPFLRGSFSISLGEAPTLSTSPQLAESPFIAFLMLTYFPSAIYHPLRINKNS
jgi:hypothetical protein